MFGRPVTWVTRGDPGISDASWPSIWIAECAGPDDDSADKVLRAFGAEIALMVTPAQGTA
jgi:hypothetical protein